MKTPERFSRAIKALVQAFFNDHLAKYNCRACAVGNIVAMSLNVKVRPDSKIEGLDYTKWMHVIDSEMFTINRTINDCIRFHETLKGYPLTIEESERAIEGYNKGLMAIHSTGYSIDDMYIIESAFEKSTKIKYSKYHSTPKQEIMLDQYNGLMAVVEVLCEIEGLNSEEYKQAFAYTEDLKPVHSI